MYGSYSWSKTCKSLRIIRNKIHFKTSLVLNTLALSFFKYLNITAIIILVQTVKNYNFGQTIISFLHVKVVQIAKIYLQNEVFCRIFENYNKNNSFDNTSIFSHIQIIFHCCSSKMLAQFLWLYIGLERVVLG